MNPSSDSPLNLVHLSKETVMPENHNDPANAAVKPGLHSSEGQIALVVVLITTAGPILAMLADKFPDDPRVQVAVAVLACVTAILTALGYVKKRSDVKETANVVAGTLAIADKAAAIAKDNPALAELLLRSAGIGGSVPTRPAAGP